MKLARTVSMNTRRARHELDVARNPREVSRHACERFIEDCKLDPLGLVGCDLHAAERHIRHLCAHASRIRRIRSCRILTSGDWFIFYRDGTVVTVMHKDSGRRRPA